MTNEEAAIGVLYGTGPFRLYNADGEGVSVMVKSLSFTHSPGGPADIELHLIVAGTLEEIPATSVLSPRPVSDSRQITV